MFCGHANSFMSIEAMTWKNQNLSGVGRPRGRVGGGGGRKNMIPPVHRPSLSTEPPSRSHRQSNHGNSQSSGNQSHGARRSPSDPVYVEVGAPQSIAQLAAARSVTPDTLLRTAALGLNNDANMMPQHLKCGMWASLALATVFVASAKFYFDRQTDRGHHNSTNGKNEAGIVCAFAFIICAMVCGAWACSRKPTLPPRTPIRVSSTLHRRPHLDSMDEELDEESPGSPPPYHIAVLLPPRAPPAYHALEPLTS